MQSRGFLRPSDHQEYMYSVVDGVDQVGCVVQGLDRECFPSLGIFREFGRFLLSGWLLGVARQQPRNETKRRWRRSKGGCTEETPVCEV